MDRAFELEEEEEDEGPSAAEELDAMAAMWEEAEAEQLAAAEAAWGYEEEDAEAAAAAALKAENEKLRKEADELAIKLEEAQGKLDAAAGGEE